MGNFRYRIRRLYRMSLRSALILSLPLALWCFWLIGTALIDLRALRHISGSPPHLVPLNFEILRFFIRDELNRMIIRATAPEMPMDDALPLLQMSMSAENLTELNRNLPWSGKTNYFRGYVKFEGKSHTVKARYVGDNHWHWLYPQKSWRIKSSKSDLIHGSRLINLKNPRSELSFNEALAMELGKELGLIAPRVFPLRFVLNSQYMGVYLWQDPIDESVIRRAGRMPGSLYSGDGALPDPITGVSLLWKDQNWWEKDASRNAEQEGDRGDIRFFLDQVNNPSLKNFYQFAERHLNKKAYAAFYSLDNLTGSHHDYHHNHKIFFDPVTGKFEPSAWDTNDWDLTKTVLDVVNNPLLIKWKLIPELDFLRLKTLYRLITEGPLQPWKIVKQINRYDVRVRPSLRADYLKDSKRFFTSQGLKLNQSAMMVFNMDQYEDQLKFYREWVRKRVAFLERYLSEARLRYQVNPNPSGWVLEIASTGNVAAKVTAIQINGAGEAFTLYRDRNLDGILDGPDDRVAAVNLTNGNARILLSELLFPGYKKIPLKPIPDILQFGNVDFVASPLIYRYFLDIGSGQLSSLKLEAVNGVTGEVIEPKSNPFTSALERETLSLHPWDHPEQPPEKVISLGPGEIVLRDTVVYPRNVILKIAPGTTFKMAENVSIFSYGRILAEGTSEKPIRFRALERGKPWGVFVLQGEGANRSRFNYCAWEDGSSAERELIEYSGAVSVHDVSDVAFRNSTFARNHLGDDLVRLAYCRNPIFENCRFTDAFMDALDADLSKNLRVSNCRFQDSGNDGLDLMTTDGRIEGSVFQNSGDKGISAGEKSNLAIEGNIFEDCRIGLQIKDQSNVEYGKNLIRRSPLAIDLYKKNWRYDGGGRLSGDTLYFLDCEKGVRKDSFSEAAYNRIFLRAGEEKFWRDIVESAGTN